MTRRQLTALAGLLAGTAVLYAFNLGRAPIYLHEAEILFVNHAYAIATTGHDTNGRLLPLYFQMPPIGANVWFHPALVYFTALFFTVLPLTEFTARLPSVAVALADVALIYFVARRLFRSHRLGLIAAALLALTPSHFMHGRIAMDYLYPVPFVLAWLLCLIVFLERPRARTLFAAASVLGVGVYTYIASVIMMPVHLAMTAFAIFRNRINPRFMAVAAAGFVWPLALLVWLWFHPGMFTETVGRYQVGQVERAPRALVGLPMYLIVESVLRMVRFSEITGRISLYWYFFDPAYLFVTGGYANIVNSTTHVGVFALPLMALMPIGIAAVVRSRTTIGILVVIGFFVAPLAACLVVPEPYAVDRELTILPFGVLLATFGVDSLLNASHRLWRTAAVALLVLVPCHFAFFLFDYYGDYHGRAAFWFNGNRRGALEEIIARDAQQHVPAVYLSTARIPYLDAYWRFYLTKHRRGDLLQRSIYFDEAVLDPQSLQAGTLVLASTDDKHLKALVESGQLKRVAELPDPGALPYFAILQR